MLYFPDLSSALENHGKNVEFKACLHEGWNAEVDCCFFRYVDEPPSTFSMKMMDGKTVNKWVEPGKFFRERMLTMGTIMPMPDI
ncbi:hypothetical protein RHMOL_Rhmol06G0311300 [Rhododendron molle]|uniref:Uncharacterized protein n=1 Tax=Rhododendron molle TaxID=49168 RepID=A0ACC0NIG6_RHOML|nr:hypothetical protein RHMOL_Rhmol06G0311300 [Rhododendron molle]